MKSWALFLVVMIPVLAVGGLVMLALRSASATPEVGLRDGHLLPLPASPNAVSSEPGTREDARVDPLPMHGDEQATRAALARLLGSDPRVTIEEQHEGYLHAVFASPLFGFRDDLELRIDEDEGLVHVRSASRVGRSDLGANRARIEHLRELWDQRRP